MNVADPVSEVLHEFAKEEADAKVGLKRHSSGVPGSFEESMKMKESMQYRRELMVKKFDADQYVHDSRRRVLNMMDGRQAAIDEVNRVLGDVREWMDDLGVKGGLKRAVAPKRRRRRRRLAKRLRAEIRRRRIRELRERKRAEGPPSRGRARDSLSDVSMPNSALKKETENGETTEEVAASATTERLDVTEGGLKSLGGGLKRRTSSMRTKAASPVPGSPPKEARSPVEDGDAGEDSQDHSDDRVNGSPDVSGGSKDSRRLARRLSGASKAVAPAQGSASEKLIEDVVLSSEDEQMLKLLEDDEVEQFYAENDWDCDTTTTEDDDDREDCKEEIDLSLAAKGGDGDGGAQHIVTDTPIVHKSRYDSDEEDALGGDEDDLNDENAASDTSVGRILRRMDPDEVGKGLWAVETEATGPQTVNDEQIDQNDGELRSGTSGGSWELGTGGGGVRRGSGGLSTIATTSSIHSLDTDVLKNAASNMLLGDAGKLKLMSVFGKLVSTVKDLQVQLADARDEALTSKTRLEVLQASHRKLLDKMAQMDYSDLSTPGGHQRQGSMSLTASGRIVAAAGQAQHPVGWGAGGARAAIQQDTVVVKNLRIELQHQQAKISMLTLNWKQKNDKIRAELEMVRGSDKRVTYQRDKLLDRMRDADMEIKTLKGQLGASEREHRKDKVTWETKVKKLGIEVAALERAGSKERALLHASLDAKHHAELQKVRTKMEAQMRSVKLQYSRAASRIERLQRRLMEQARQAHVSGGARRHVPIIKSDGDRGGGSSPVRPGGGADVGGFVANMQFVQNMKRLHVEEMEAAAEGFVMELHLEREKYVRRQAEISSAWLSKVQLVEVSCQEKVEAAKNDLQRLFDERLREVTNDYEEQVRKERRERVQLEKEIVELTTRAHVAEAKVAVEAVESQVSKAALQSLREFLKILCENINQSVENEEEIVKRLLLEEEQAARGAKRGEGGVDDDPSSVAGMSIPAARRAAIYMQQQGLDLPSLASKMEKCISKVMDDTIGRVVALKAAMIDREDSAIVREREHSVSLKALDERANDVQRDLGRRLMNARGANGILQRRNAMLVRELCVRLVGLERDQLITTINQVGEMLRSRLESRLEAEREAATRRRREIALAKRKRREAERQRRLRQSMRATKGSRLAKARTGVHSDPLADPNDDAKSEDNDSEALQGEAADDKKQAGIDIGGLSSSYEYDSEFSTSDDDGSNREARGTGNMLTVGSEGGDKDEASTDGSGDTPDGSNKSETNDSDGRKQKKRKRRRKKSHIVVLVGDADGNNVAVKDGDGDDSESRRKSDCMLEGLKDDSKPLETRVAEMLVSMLSLTEMMGSSDDNLLSLKFNVADILRDAKVRIVEGASVDVDHNISSTHTLSPGGNETGGRLSLDERELLRSRRSGQLGNSRKKKLKRRSSHSVDRSKREKA